jgi:hypothetical protein
MVFTLLMALLQKKTKCSDNSFPCVEVHSTTTRASGGVGAKEGKNFYQTFQGKEM